MQELFPKMDFDCLGPTSAFYLIVVLLFHFIFTIIY